MDFREVRAADEPLDLRVRSPEFSVNDPAHDNKNHSSNDIYQETDQHNFSNSIKPVERRKVRPLYSKENLQLSLVAVNNGSMTTYAARRMFGVPRSTIQYRIGKKYKHKGKRGPFPILTIEEETKIVFWLQEMERKGFPITRHGLILKVSSYLKGNPRVTPFKNGVPGKHWFHGFLRRHPELSLRTPEGVTSASSKVSEKNIRSWFQKVHDYLLEHNLADALADPSRILNADETGFSLNSVPKKVIGTKGAKNIPAIETGKKNITVLFTFAADGTVIPSDIILPYKRLSREIIQSFPVNWGLGNSENGWMDTRNFVLYINKVLYPSLLKNGTKFPVIFFVDGHTSHTGFEAADACSKLGIILIALFPNATRLLQPADVAIFRPLKSNWGKVVEVWKTNTMAEQITITTFGTLLQEAMQLAFKPSTISNGFRTCGLYPYNPDAVDYTKCIAKKHPTPMVQKSAELPINSAQEVARVPITVIRKTIELIGPEKISMFQRETTNQLSNEDKALSYIYKNFLASYNESHSPSTENSETVSENGNFLPFCQDMSVDNSVDMPEDEVNIAIDDENIGVIPEEDINVKEEAIGHYSSPVVPSNALELTPKASELNLQQMMDITNFPKKRRLSQYFQTPPTPKRSSKHRNYKSDFFAVLTAEERLRDMQEKEMLKEEAAVVKVQKAELRIQQKIEKQETERIRKQRAVDRLAARAEKAEAEIVRKQGVAERAAARAETKKQIDAIREKNRVEREEKRKARKEEKKNLRATLF